MLDLVVRTESWVTLVVSLGLDAPAHGLLLQGGSAVEEDTLLLLPMQDCIQTN